MSEVLFKIHFMGGAWVVTPWKLVGYGGVLIFAGRWLVQVVASHRARRSHLPRVFWYMSLVGSLLLLAYFALSGKRDSVGIFSNLFPAGIAAYNLLLELRRNRCDRIKEKTVEADAHDAVEHHEFVGDQSASR